MKEAIHRGLYRCIRRIVWLFSPKYRLVGVENLPEGACVIAGNHCQMYGPIATELYTPGPHKTWCIGEMMHKEEVADYAYQDFWSGKPRYIRWFFRLFSHMITPLAVLIFNQADTIPVYHDARGVTTFKETVKCLCNDEKVAIFPECYDEHNNIVHEFQEGFVDVAKLYWRKTKQELSFVPMYIAPNLNEIHFGKPVQYDASRPVGEERARIAGELMDTITEMAVALPEHVVVPYPNIPRREYPKNLPLEVYTNEKTTV